MRKPEGSIAARLKEWRHSLGLTQAQFADRIGVHLGVLQKYEMGRNVPGGTVLAAIARTGVNLNWLLTGEGEMRSPEPDLRLADQMQVYEGKGQKRTAAEDVRRLIRQIERILESLPPEEARRKAEELFARAQEIEEQHRLRQALEDLRQKLGRLTGTD